MLLQPSDGKGTGAGSARESRSPQPSLPGPLSPASHLVPDNAQAGQRCKKGPGGFRFSTQVGQELFVHPWDLGHPPTVPSDPGSGSGTVLSSPPRKHHEPGMDLDIPGVLQQRRRSSPGNHRAPLALFPMVARFSRWPGPRGTHRDCWGQAGSGCVRWGMEGEGLVGPPGCWVRVLGSGERGQIWGKVQELGAFCPGASGPGDRSGSGVGVRVPGLVWLCRGMPGSLRRGADSRVPEGNRCSRGAALPQPRSRSPEHPRRALT